MRTPSAVFYTQGHFGKGIRETLDTDNPLLYSQGRYRTKIQVKDLPEYYCPIHSRSIWYMQGFLKTAGVTDIAYTYCKENHLFKDDYIYLCYDGKLVKSAGRWNDYDNGLAISGNDIVPIVLFVEKYSPNVDTSEVRRLIAEKVKWLHDNEPEFYELCFHTTEIVDVFTTDYAKGY